jgi:hypothetical protein
MGFLDKGSLLKHRNLGFVVGITDIQNGLYQLGWAHPEKDRFVRYALNGPWTAADIVREFSPQIQASKLDRLLDDHLIDDDQS